MINSSLLFLRQCESLDWSDCLVVLLLSATHFRKSGHACLIRGCFSFSQCFQAGVFSSLSPPPSRSLWLAPSPPLLGKFQHGGFGSKLCVKRKRLHCRLSHHGIWAIIACYPKMVIVGVCWNLKTSWKSVVFTNKSERILDILWAFIPPALVGYEMIIANYHLISNAHSWNHC